jgi:hypothetical protein
MTTNELDGIPNPEENTAIVSFSKEGVIKMIEIREKHGWNTALSSVTLLFTHATAILVAEKVRAGMTRSLARKKLHEMMGGFERDVARDMKELLDNDKKSKRNVPD